MAEWRRQTGVFKLSKLPPNPSVLLPPAKPHFLNTPEQRHQLVTELSNAETVRDILIQSTD